MAGGAKTRYYVSCPRHGMLASMPFRGPTKEVAVQPPTSRKSRNGGCPLCAKGL